MLLLMSITTAYAQRVRDVQRQFFVENRGQWDMDARYLLRTPGMDAWICQDRVVYSIGSGTDNTENPHIAITSHFVGANAKPTVVGAQRVKHTHSYYLGDDPSKWVTNVPLYSGVEIKGLYDGIDLAFYVDAGRPRYDVVVAPYADASTFSMRIEGAKDVQVDAKGSLIITSRTGELRVQELFAYQMRNATHEYVPCSFVIHGDGTIGFDVGAYDPSLPLVIDPITVSFSTFLGGSDEESSKGIVVSDDGAVYVTGRTQSTDFPTGNEELPGQGGKTIYLSKMKQESSGVVDLVYTVFIGGSGIEDVSGLATDGKRNFFITGETFSRNFPLLHEYQKDQAGTDAFVAKFSEDVNGTVTLAYSTYLGGGEADQPLCITADANGIVYVAGSTLSTDFPTNHEYQKDQAVGDGFVAKLSQSGTAAVALEFSTYLGGDNRESIADIAVDGQGAIYIAGSTESSDFPTVNQYQADQPQADGFVAAIRQQGTDPATLIFSTYLGGDDIESVSDISVEVNGNVIVAGRTRSTNYPQKLQLQEPGGNFDVFITKLTKTGGPLEIVFSTYFGGSDADGLGAMVIDGTGNIYLAGSTPSTNFPVLHQYQSDQPQSDVYVSKLSQTGQDPVTMVYSTYLGGDTLESAADIAVDAAGSAYITGLTTSDDFPSINGFQAKAAKSEVFIAKIDAFGQGPTSVDDEVPSPMPMINAATPNPTSDDLSINLELTTGGVISVTVLNANGQIVMSPINEEYRPQGLHHQNLDVHSLPSGVYSLQLITTGTVESRQFVIIR